MDYGMQAMALEVTGARNADVECVELESGRAETFILENFPEDGEVFQDEAKWLETMQKYDRALSTGAYCKTIYNIGLGRILRRVPKATNKGSDALSRLKLYGMLMISSRSAAEYMKMAEHWDIVVATLHRAAETREPITQARILELIGVHEGYKGRIAAQPGYLQMYDEVMLQGFGSAAKLGTGTSE